MAIRVEASRFAVLKVEDDNDSDDKNSKPKHPQPGKGNQQQKQNDAKKKAKKKKKPEEIRTDAENPASRKGSRKEISDSQWEQWMQKNDESVDKEFEEQLNDALLQSKLEYEEKQRTGAAVNGNGTANEDKKNKKKSRTDVTNTVPSESSNRKVVAVSKDIAKPKSSEAQCDAPGTKDRTSPQNSSQGDLPKKNVIIDYKAAILEKEEQVKELREHNIKIEAEVADMKKKNQQFCLMLCNGEMMDQASIKAELEALQQVRDNLTLEVAQCLSELEKERSKSHALKAERDKLKTIRLGGK